MFTEGKPLLYAIWKMRKMGEGSTVDTFMFQKQTSTF